MRNSATRPTADSCTTIPRAAHRDVVSDSVDDQLRRTVVAWSIAAKPGEQCVLWDLDRQIGADPPWGLDLARVRAIEADLAAAAEPAATGDRSAVLSRRERHFRLWSTRVDPAEALAPEISTWPDENPQLIGSQLRCVRSHHFPVQERCPKCSAGDMSDVLLPRSGTLVAWTTQGFRPEPPYKGPTGKDFVPFGVGLVQLDDVVRVEGRLTENDPDKLHFGMEVELTMVPFTTDDDGNEVVTFAFQPV